jgi:hypothetical protein
MNDKLVILRMLIGHVLGPTRLGPAFRLNYGEHSDSFSPKGNRSFIRT